MITENLTDDQQESKNIADLVDHLRDLALKPHIKELEVLIPTETCISPGYHKVSELLYFIADMLEE